MDWNRSILPILISSTFSNWPTPIILGNISLQKVLVGLKRNYCQVKIETNFFGPNMYVKSTTYFLQSLRKMSLYCPLKLSNWLFKSSRLSWLRKVCFGHNIGAVWWYFTNAEVNPLRTKRVHIIVWKIVLFMATSWKCHWHSGDAQSNFLYFNLLPYKSP